MTNDNIQSHNDSENAYTELMIGMSVSFSIKTINDKVFFLVSP